MGTPMHMQDPACGTRSFSAPEMLARHEGSAKSDMWSLGCVLWHMIVGQTPWHELTPDCVLIEVVTNGSVPPMETVWNSPVVSATEMGSISDVVDVMGACFSQEPAERPSALQVQAVLEQAAKRLSI